jgi:hypothetical protein
VRTRRSLARPKTDRQPRRTLRMVITLAVLPLAALVLAAPALVMAAPASAATDFGFIWLPSSTTTQNLCLAINGSGNAEIAVCTFEGGQLFHLGAEYGTSGYYQFVDADGLCLAVAGGSTANGAQVIGTTCETGSAHEDQYWTRDGISSGTEKCYIFNYKSGYVAAPASSQNLDPVKQYIWNGDPNQVWVS